MTSWTLNHYQREAMGTSADLTREPRTLTPDELGVLLAALGMAGEAGEFADHVKKWLAQGHPLDFEKLDIEAGDVLWYIARYADARQTSLEEIARKNRRKLQARYPDGFCTEASLNRDDAA